MAQRVELLARLATAVADAPESDSLTWRLCEATRRVLGADGASMTVDNASTNRITLAATDRVAAQLEDLHDVLGEGPATEAFTSGQPVVVDLEQPQGDWSAFAEAAARRTAAVVVLALPMRSDAAVLGVLTLYLLDHRSLAEPMTDALFLVDALAAAVLHDYAVSSDLGDGGSWSNRAQVHQATGMVVAQLGIGVRDAMALLRAHAFALDQNLAQVADAVTHGEIAFARGGRRP